LLGEKEHGSQLAIKRLHQQPLPLPCITPDNGERGLVVATEEASPPPPPVNDDSRGRVIPIAVRMHHWSRSVVRRRMHHGARISVAIAWGHVRSRTSIRGGHHD
jgi:hypothetical protein